MLRALTYPFLDLLDILDEVDAAKSEADPIPRIPLEDEADSAMRFVALGLDDMETGCGERVIGDGAFVFEPVDGGPASLLGGFRRPDMGEKFDGVTGSDNFVVLLVPYLDGVQFDAVLDALFLDGLQRGLSGETVLAEF